MSGPSLLLPPELRERADGILAAGRAEGGWLITGPKQVGKGTFARAFAAAILAGADRLGGEDDKTRHLVGEEGHPDLFILKRHLDEKTGKLPANIKVDDVRDVTARFRQTAATGHRVVIVDTADDMNTAAANALLKTLEEPPAGATLFLLSAAPGRLLPTIRSRCRRLDLTHFDDGTIREWLVSEIGFASEEAEGAAKAARGRPGRAYELATGAGRLAWDLADNLISAATGRGDIVMAARAFAEKDAEDARTDAQELILARLSDAARHLARGEETERAFAGMSSSHRLVEVHDELASLIAKSEGLNADRTQTALAIAMTLGDALRGSHAGR